MHTLYWIELYLHRKITKYEAYTTTGTASKGPFSPIAAFPQVGYSSTSSEASPGQRFVAPGWFVKGVLQRQAKVL